MANQKGLAPYKPVLHATETARRDKYKGCVSRQHLRAVLRKECQQDIRIVETKMIADGKQRFRKSHAEVRAKAFSMAKSDYRWILGLK